MTENYLSYYLILFQFTYMYMTGYTVELQIKSETKTLHECYQCSIILCLFIYIIKVTYVLLDMQ